MCRPRSVSEEQLSRIKRIVCRNPMLTASEVADKAGGLRERLVRFYLRELRSEGLIPKWQGRKPGPSEMTERDKREDEAYRAWLNDQAQADFKWTELMAGRSYA